jgi:hypothetical protein
MLLKLGYKLSLLLLSFVFWWSYFFYSTLVAMFKNLPCIKLMLYGYSQILTFVFDIYAVPCLSTVFSHNKLVRLKYIPNVLHTSHHNGSMIYLNIQYTENPYVQTYNSMPVNITHDKTVPFSLNSTNKPKPYVTQTVSIEKSTISRRLLDGKISVLPICTRPSTPDKGHIHSWSWSCRQL